jgi:hypothetical protein
LVRFDPAMTARRRTRWLLSTALTTACGGSAGGTTAEAPTRETPPLRVEADRPDGEKVEPIEPVESVELVEPKHDEEPAAAGHADLDPSNDRVVGPPEPISDCEAQLEAAGITFSPARIGVGRKRDGVYTCGAKQVVRFRRGPGEIRYDKSPPLLTCGMALALADFERIVQEEAQRVLGSRVVRIDHLGTYNCRDMVNYDLISEHSFANALDLRRFHLANGKKVGVLEHFRPTQAAADAEPSTLFLRSLANRLYDENIFSVVVTPYFDRLHHNHIHVDLARYRVDGSRP